MRSDRAKEIDKGTESYVFLNIFENMNQVSFSPNAELINRILIIDVNLKKR